MIAFRRLACLILLMAAGIAQAGAPETNAHSPLRVMVVGNSLVYSNNLPGLLRSLARSQPDGPAIETESYVAPGEDLAGHWKRGAAARALQARHWDALVLQERGGTLACLESLGQKDEPACRASVRAHRQFAELAQKHGIRVLLLGTWGPDDQWQQRLDRALLRIARQIGATAVGAGARLRAYQSAHRATALFTDAALHPSLPASLMLAAMLYRDITGRSAQAHDVVLDVPLLRPLAALDGSEPLEHQNPIGAVADRTVVPAAELSPLLQAIDGQR